MESIHDRASTQRVLLLLGLIDIKEAVSWADAEIEMSDTPSNALIDLAMAGSESIANVVSTLAELAVESDVQIGIKSAFQVMAEQVRSNDLEIGFAIMSAFKFLQAENVLYKHDEYLTFIGLEDEYAAIKDGILGDGDFTVLRDPLLEALDRIANMSLPSNG